MKLSLEQLSARMRQGETIPSRPFVEGGIHEAIMEYENNVFFDILAEDLARRVLCLPLYAELRPEEVENISDIVIRHL